MLDTPHFAMTKIDTDQVLPKQSDIMREMAQDMNVALYRRYGTAAAAKTLGMSIDELDQLRERGEVGYLDLTDNQISFLGYQLITYLLACIVDPGAEPRLRSPPASPAGTALISEASELLTVKETMAMLKIGRTKLYEMINANQIEYVKIGQQTRIKRASLRRLID